MNSQVMELGVYSFGDTPRTADGSLGHTAQAIRNLLEAIVTADQVGLDYFGVGEHHVAEMPASSPAVVLSAAAAVTERIRLGSSVSVLSTDDPVRVFQQFATADAISNGRVEITAGRGSSTESFPLFGYSLSDYDELYTEKLDLLLRINRNERVTWSGEFRAPLHDIAIVPRPINGSLPIWLGTGGTPGSSASAGQLGLPVAYGIIGGQPKRFAPLADLYRESARRAGHRGPGIKVAVAALGFVADTDEEARELFYVYWHAISVQMSQSRGFPPPSRRDFNAQASGDGAFFIGGPDSVADRIVELHRHLGHARHFLQMDIGGVPQEDYLRAITLLGTEVAPRVRKLLGT